MNRVSSIKTYQSPTLWVEIDDLRVPCAVPSVNATEALLKKAQVVTAFGGGVTQEMYDSIFELFAELLSCNHNFMTFTPDELKKKNVTVTQIMGILTDWVKFIGDLPTEKN
jgi:hypothetical protein